MTKKIPFFILIFVTIFSINSFAQNQIKKDIDKQCPIGQPHCSFTTTNSFYDYKDSKENKESNQSNINIPPKQQKETITSHPIGKTNTSQPQITYPEPPKNLPKPNQTDKTQSNDKVKEETKKIDEKFLSKNVEIDDSKKIGYVYNNIIEVLPETTTKVELSNIDINRIICSTEIKDVVFSKEKGLNVKIQGKNAFLKYVIIKDNNEEIYVTLPNELYVVCNDEVYSMIIYPKKIPAQIVNLTKGKQEKIKKNLELFSNMPHEKKILTMIKYILTDNIPESFNIVQINQQIEKFNEIQIIYNRFIIIEGEGIKIKEYTLTANKDIYLKEKQFLTSDFTNIPYAIVLEDINLKKGQKTKLLIIERNS